MQKTQCDRRGNKNTEILRRGKFSQDNLFCPSYDYICNKLG
jgi:hypothetical protein